MVNPKRSPKALLIRVQYAGDFCKELQRCWAFRLLPKKVKIFAKGYAESVDVFYR